jgi:hypothetical protein
MSEAQRQLRSRIGGLSMIATHGADNANLRAARQGFLDRFLRGIDQSLPERERLERAEVAKRMYMTQLSLKSSLARARKRRRDGGQSPLGGGGTRRSRSG